MRATRGGRRDRRHASLDRDSVDLTVLGELTALLPLAATPAQTAREALAMLAARHGAGGAEQPRTRAASRTAGALGLLEVAAGRGRAAT